MKRFMNKKLLVVGVAVALVLGVGGAAFAYFSSTGSGTGSAGVGTGSNLIITQIGAPVYNSLSPHLGSCTRTLKRDRLDRVRQRDHLGTLVPATLDERAWWSMSATSDDGGTSRGRSRSTSTTRRSEDRRGQPYRQRHPDVRHSGGWKHRR